MQILNKRFFLNGGLVVMITSITALVYHCKNPNLESDYYNPKVLATHFNGEHYVGSETCMECHADIYSSHLKTAHYNTSAPVNENNILGSFEPGANVLDLEYVKFIMERKADSLYQQTVHKNRTEKKPPSTFDIVVGSGVRGQSYATWKGNQLFQLQTSYHTPSNSWVNSPGFPTFADRDRPVRDACLKCHVSFATNLDFSGQGNRYDKEKTIYGIACEKCHRPSEKHVVYHRKNPEDEIANFMLPLDSLSRQQRLDVCAQCHSGSRNRLIQGNSFSFLPGENLDEYARNSYKTSPNEKLDVHGNQYGLLIQSECFKQSEQMDCITCHNPHKNQRGNTSYFNQKCVGCHTTDNVVCAAEPSEKKAMSNNCIACHMPVTPSESMTVQLKEYDSLETSFYIRTHLIKVYPEEDSNNP